MFHPDKREATRRKLTYHLPTPTSTASRHIPFFLFGTFDRRTWCLTLWQPSCDYDRRIFNMLRMAEQKGIFPYQRLKCNEAASHANMGVGGRSEQSHLAEGCFSREDIPNGHCLIFTTKVHPFFFHFHPPPLLISSFWWEHSCRYDKSAKITPNTEEWRVRSRSKISLKSLILSLRFHAQTLQFGCYICI